MVGGTIFLTSFILSGTLSDFKEGERFPSEIASSLENLYIEGDIVHEVESKFDIQSFRSRLHTVASCILEELENEVDWKKRKTIEAIENLSISIRVASKDSFKVMRDDHRNLLRATYRAFQIKDTSFIPAAYAITEILSIFVYIALLLMSFGSLATSLVITSIITFLFVYLVLLIRDMDDPFGESYAYVDLYLIRMFKDKTQAYADPNTIYSN